MEEKLFRRPLFDVNALFGFVPNRKVEAGLNKVKALAESAGVRRICVCSLKGAHYDYEMGNNETLQVCRGDSSLVPVATLDPRRYLPRKGEVERLKSDGFLLLRLFPEVQNWPYRLEPFRRIVDELCEHPLVLLAPVRGLGSITELSDQIPRDAPFPVVLLGVNYWTLSEALAVMLERKNFYLETHLLDSPDGYEVVAREVGAKRMVFGSGLPFTGPHAPALALEQSELSDEEKELVARRNLEGLLECVSRS